MTPSRTVRHLAIAGLSLCVFANTSAAQPQNPLPEAIARQKVADDKAQKEVLAAIADAERLAKTNPPKAVQALRQAQVIADSPVISTQVRKDLVALLERKIAVIQGRALPEPGATPAAPGVKLDPNAPAAKAAREDAFKRYATEMKDVREGVERFAKYKQSGQDKEAAQELAQLVKTYPNNPSVIGLQQRDNLADQVRDSLAFAELQQQRINMAFKSVDQSSLPIGGNGDIEFPKDWKEKTKRRLQTIELTAAEKKIIESLNKPITVNWNGKPLSEALQELSNHLDQKLFIDEKSVSDLGIDLQKPFTLQANGVSARTVLRQVLASQGLTFVIKDQVLQVMDTERAKHTLVTRVYYLGDLARGVGPFGGLEWGPIANFQQTMANVEAIMKTITSSIDPLSWKEKGGPASLTFHYPSMSIIVRALAEVHASLGATLSGGR